MCEKKWWKGRRLGREEQKGAEERGCSFLFHRCVIKLLEGTPPPPPPLAAAVPPYPQKTHDIAERRREAPAGCV